MKVALVCIAKNEDVYINEWISYHRKLGFDHIFIYENDWVSGINLPYVTTIQFPGRSRQFASYNDFINKHKQEFDYVAFFDCDEFLVLKKHQNVQDFLSEHGNPNGVAINWQVYGSNGKLKRDGNSIIKQFTRRQNGVNHHIKTILNLKSNAYMSIAHHPNIPTFDPKGIKVIGPFHPHGDDSIAILNHYYLMSFEDWEIKCKRGRVDVDEYTYVTQTWHENVNTDNDVEDLTAYNFMYGDETKQ